MIEREVEGELKCLAREFRSVLIIGPRQSGKTTLAKKAFPNKPYVLLEEPDARRFATDDPRGFLAGFPDGAILDEVHKTPELLSYIQGILDESPRKGLFVLTGSCNFKLMESVSQSLAGRVGQIELLPLSALELSEANQLPETIDETLFKGGYPEIYDQSLTPERWHNAYISTYLERDVRQLTNLKDSMAFQRFLGLCAANCAQTLNFNKIGADCGMHHNTVSSWFSILQTTYVAFLLPPHFQNFRKRLVKTPKIYFYDTGLLCGLLGIEKSEQLRFHPLRGALFENWVVSELLKARFNQGKKSNLFFWRNNTGLEVDVIMDKAGTLVPLEIKSGATIASDWFKNIVKWKELAGESSEKGVLVYGGNQRQKRSDCDVVPWNRIMTIPV
ncbi:MAG: ATP-binding protein [Kiritimatiellaeota bacterium]|nr:ATP-binding protein [Kiritimatiellota bacterium]